MSLITVRANNKEGETESQNQVRRITYKELKQHSTYDDAWLSINRVVYDITHFIDKHPHGDTFRGHLGSECGGLFSSAHTNTNVEKLIKNEEFLSKNNIKVMGRLDVTEDRLYRFNKSPFLERIVYQETDHDVFWQELQSGVADYLKEHNETTHYSSKVGALFLCYYLCIYLCLSYLVWVYGSVVAAVLLGLHSICMLANVSHMATHSGFTDSPLLDFVAMHLFDLVGFSGMEWQITHQTHHHQPHSSLDHQTNTYRFFFVRIHNYMKYRNHHRYQFIYFWVAVCLYLLMKILQLTVWVFLHREFFRHKYDWVSHFLAKGILLSQICYCLHLHGYWGLVVFAVFAISISQVAFLLLYNDHEENHKFLGGVEDVSSFHGTKSWAEVQVRTSGNWYPTNWFLAFIEFHYGYFNYHIEHHLFPTFKPSLLKKISPIVKSICSKHGIPYISTPFIEVQKSLQGHLSKMSRNPLPPKADLEPTTTNGFAGFPKTE